MSEEINHSERAHSKFSASGSERWLNCSASVALEEQSPPSVDNFWSKEGTLAHEVLEAVLNRAPIPDSFDVTREMISNVEKVARKIRAIQQAEGGTLLVEKRVYATFIHEEMFGTCDAIIAGNDRTLHIIDFKYGAGHIVAAEKNTQLIQYALSVAESYDWDFDRVKMWIMQPRAGENWFKSWTITIDELKNQWLPLWQKGVARVESGRTRTFAGHWCHWCRAKNICPEKQEQRVAKVANYFNNESIEREVYGIKKENKKGQTASFKSSRKEESEIDAWQSKPKGKAQSKNGFEESEESFDNFGWQD